jgi:MoaA/NifB/PqqE/SkfB family radical SAM enzyme
MGNPSQHSGFDGSMMFVMLLEKCNFSCPHCIWIDGRLEHIPKLQPGFSLSFNQITTCLTDCKRIDSIKKVHFSGGEPTLWRDGDMNFGNVLVEVAREGFIPSFITNGSNFVNYRKCHNFFDYYFSESDNHLGLQLTIDTFHDNFDTATARAACLDNILRMKQEMHFDADERLSIEVVAVISKSPDTLLPGEMIEYYRSQGIDFIFTPLLNAGKAKSFSHQCPDLDEPAPESMGAFYPFYQEWYERLGNKQSLRLWVDEYRLFGEPIASLGQLNKSLLDDYLKNH